MIYKIIVDKQPSSNPSSEKKEYTIDIEELRTKGDVYDSLIITKDEDYVMRRLSLSELEVLTVLEEPIKEHLQDINIELFEGDNYIYIMDKTGNKFYAKYIVKNDFTDIYCTVNQMQSAIVQSAGQIELSVNQKLTDADNKIQEINGKLELKVDKDDNGQVVSMLNASADIIRILGNRFILDSTNFKVSEEGNITAVSGDIGGFSLGETSFKSNLNGLYGYTYYDAILIKYQIMENVHLNNAIQEILDANSDNKFTSTDLYVILNIIKGTIQNTKRVEGTVEINSNDPKNCFKVSKDGEDIVSIGVGGINTNLITTENFVCGCWSGSSGTSDDFKGVVIDSQTSTIYIDGENSSTIISSTGISTPSLTQTSKEEQKKNIEKYTNNALEILKNIDIYKYNFKNEDDKTKKHLGFVIGNKYKYSEEVTSNENNGVDLYSFVSLCCKAIQEQQQEIEELRQEIQELKGGKVDE